MAKKRKEPLLQTHTGHELTPSEEKFIQLHIQGKTHREAIKEAGYNVKYPEQLACNLLNKYYISEEIKFRMDQMRKESIASAEEILQYFTNVMRGEVKDQFGLEAPLSERTKAGQELAKRVIDMVQKAAERAGTGEASQIVVKLVRDKDNVN